MKEKSSIVRVLHDQDGDWQFLGDEGLLQESDAMVVSLEEIIDFDDTILEVMSLPIGKQAMRNNKGALWYIYDI